MRFIKFIIRIIFYSLAAVIIFFAWNDKESLMEKVNFLAEKITGQKEIWKRKLPALEGPVNVKYQWQYAGTNYELTETLYQSSYNFYKSSPKSFKYSGELPADWEEQFYGMFMKKIEGENTFQKIALDIQNLGKQKKMNDDQIAELVLAFVQSIEYDDVKAQIILGGGDGAEAKYPYETLFEKKGVCSDKSFLAVSLLRELGYGTAIFSYEAEKHMAIGIKCSKEYSSYDSGYCYAETTSPGFKIGVIPDVNEQNKAVAQKEISYFDASQMDKFNVKNLGQVEILQKSDGKIYGGIIKTVQIAKEIDALKKEIYAMGGELASSKKKIDDYDKQLNDLKSKLDKYMKNAEYGKYNETVSDYNNLIKEYKKEISSYNQKISMFNKKVDRFNQLIKN